MIAKRVKRVDIDCCKTNWLRMIAVGVVAVMLTSCSESGPRRYPIKGTVKLNGQPVDNATVILTPVGKGLAAAATIRNGAFELPAAVGPSAGEFKVRINPNEPEIEEVTDSAHPPKANARPRIPKMYQQEGALNAKITGEPGQSLEFTLTSK